MTSISKRHNLLCGRTGHLFGGPHHRSLVRDPKYYRQVLKYIYRNPVKANLCKRVEDYPFSTLHGLLGKARAQMPLHLTRVGMEVSMPDHEGELYLSWLNTPFSSEIDLLIQRSLRKRVFDKILDRSSRAEPLLSLL